MKITNFFILFLLLASCGPELQNVVQRDQYNRIVLEAELKGKAAIRCGPKCIPITSKNLSKTIQHC